MTSALSILSLAIIAGLSQSAYAATLLRMPVKRNTVLLSSENVMQLADGKTEPTG